MLTSKISEIFVSIQGEGIYVGMPHLFIRFYGCNLSCDYCDTPLKQYRVYTVPQLLQKIAGYDRNRYRMISLTGGEPLLQSAFLKELLPGLKKQGHQIYLETNASLPEALIDIYPWVDMIAADIKTPYLNEPGFPVRQSRFLTIGKSKLFVKIVIARKTRLSAVKKALALIARTGYTQEIVLQPDSARLLENLKKAETVMRYCQRHGFKTRVIPQMHRLLSIR